MKRIRLDKLSGAELKDLLERIVSDGKINTIPELMAFVAGAPEGVTLQEYITQVMGEGSVGTRNIQDESIQYEDLNPGIFASDEDIENLFSET